jgi:hypothetical protein
MRKIYTFLGLIVLFAINIDAQIIFTDLIPDVKLTGNVQSNPNGDTIVIDLNNDNQHDYELSMVNTSGLKFAYIQSGQPSNPANNAIAAVNTTTPRDIIALKSNDTIYTNQPWESVAGGNLNMVTDFMGTSSGQWISLKDGYIGCRFFIGTATHYGWIRAGISANNDTLYIKSYAYNSKPNECIIAGNTTTTTCSMPTNINENVLSEEIKLYPNPANNSVTVHTPNKYNSITVLDILGNEVLTQSLQNTTTKINTSTLPEGIYIYLISNKEGETASGKLQITR